jgi:hypothetical protein
MELNIITAFDNSSTLLINKIVNFVYKNQSGSDDAKENIYNAVEYALSPYKYQGGFILILEENNTLVGCLVINRTNMDGYMPKNRLVYMGSDPLFRKLGIEKKMISKAASLSSGDLACHVSIDNPIINLFEEIGFEKNFFELRLKK